jgi:hypothetical protein
MATTTAHTPLTQSPKRNQIRAKQCLFVLILLSAFTNQAYSQLIPDGTNCLTDFEVFDEGKLITPLDTNYIISPKPDLYNFIRYEIDCSWCCASRVITITKRTTNETMSIKHNSCGRTRTAFKKGEFIW